MKPKGLWKPSETSASTWFRRASHHLPSLLPAQAVGVRGLGFTLPRLTGSLSLCYTHTHTHTHTDTHTHTRSCAHTSCTLQTAD